MNLLSACHPPTSYLDCGGAERFPLNSTTATHFCFQRCSEPHQEKRLLLLPYSFAMGKLSRPVFGFEIVDGTTFVCHGGCGFVCTRSCHARNHARVCASLKKAQEAARLATLFKCTACTFSTVHRANLSKHIKMMHVHLEVHLCKCGKPCAGPADDGESAR